MTQTDAVVKIPVRPELLEQVLAPYKRNCRYLKQAVVEHPERPGEAANASDHPGLIWAHGEFAIARS